MSEDGPQNERHEGHPPEDEFARGKRIARLTKKLLDRGPELGRAVIETSDKAKSEAVKMVAREVRNYLEELKIKEDLLHLATTHSLQVNVSLSLKPLEDALSEGSDEGQAVSEPEEELVEQEIEES